MFRSSAVPSSGVRVPIRAGVPEMGTFPNGMLSSQMKLAPTKASTGTLRQASRSGSKCVLGKPTQAKRFNRFVPKVLGKSAGSSEAKSNGNGKDKLEAEVPPLNPPPTVPAPPNAETKGGYPSVCL
eukprot:669194-Prorocentrum_minimum.AAC.2